MYRKFLVLIASFFSTLVASESPTEEQLALMREYHLTVPPIILRSESKPVPTTTGKLPDIANDKKIDVEFGPWDPVELPLKKKANPEPVYQGIESVDDESFEKKVEHAPGITIVDCWSTWCTPCARMAPGFEALSREMTDLRFKKVDIDLAQVAASRMDVRSIPEVVIFDSGKIIASTIGYKTVDELRTWIRMNTRVADIVEIPDKPRDRASVPVQAPVSAEYSVREPAPEYRSRVMARGSGRR